VRVCVTECARVSVCESEIVRVSVRESVCVWERVCTCECERETVCVCVRVCACECERETVCVCVWECVWQSVRVWVCVRESVCVWVWESVRVCVCGGNHFIAKPLSNPLNRNSHGMLSNQHMHRCCTEKMESWANIDQEAEGLWRKARRKKCGSGQSLSALRVSATTQGTWRH
jgi:hypothetical protein